MPIWNFHLKLRSKHGERNSDPSTTRRAPIQAHRSTTSADLKLRSKHGEKNADPSTARGTPIQAQQEERRSATSANLLLSVFVGVSVCGCIWFCGVYGWFCGWFLIVCGSVCIRGSGVGCADGEEREKKGAKLEIIKITYRRAHENF